MVRCAFRNDLFALCRLDVGCGIVASPDEHVRNLHLRRLGSARGARWWQHRLFAAAFVDVARE